MEEREALEKQIRLLKAELSEEVVLLRESRVNAAERADLSTKQLCEAEEELEKGIL